MEDEVVFLHEESDEVIEKLRKNLARVHGAFLYLKVMQIRSLNQD